MPEPRTRRRRTSLNATKERAIAGWLREVARIASMYADEADPERTWQNPVANALDGVRKSADRAHLELTGHTILVYQQEAQS